MFERRVNKKKLVLVQMRNGEENESRSLQDRLVGGQQWLDMDEKTELYRQEELLVMRLEHDWSTAFEGLYYDNKHTLQTESS